ncbi:hypothetical protein BDV98DRAFT_575992 [Pterulicium gracile]|uniref:SET domain-containing protein n=1 Tax=Pterulicium gracile TaxID=1884261 RepID=A0A5C3QDD6_9AGAR|nr:hypothetical protein BDV98DRAFT_575992 [Pterula gracilis]
MHEDLPPDHIIVSVIPQSKEGTALDGYTQCIIPNRTKKYIMTTPNFPAAVPPPSLGLAYKVTKLPGKGLGILAMRDVQGGQLVLAERPLVICPLVLPSQEYIKSMPDHFTIEDYLIAALQGNERFMEVSFSTMPAEKKPAFLALHSAHTADGSGPIVGRLRTNTFGIHELMENPEEVHDQERTFSGICEVGSRFNHRYVDLDFCATIAV